VPLTVAAAAILLYRAVQASVPLVLGLAGFADLCRLLHRTPTSLASAAACDH